MIKGKQAEKKAEKCALWTAEVRFGDREYKTPAHLGNEVVAGIKSPYSHIFLRCKGYILFLV